MTEPLRRTSRRLAELAKAETVENETPKRKSKAQLKKQSEPEEEQHVHINRPIIGPEGENFNPFSYMVSDNVPVSIETPDYSVLEEGDRKLSLLESGSLFYSLQKSRNSWLSGDMFDKYWIRPPRGKKASENVHLNAPGNVGGANARDKMARLHECSMVIGPHVFDIRLFTAKDELPPDESDEEDVKEENEKEGENSMERSETSTLKEDTSRPNDEESEPNRPQLPPGTPLIILRTPQEVQAKKLQLLNKQEATDLMMKLATRPETATDEDKTRFARFLDEANMVELPPNYVYRPNAPKQSGRPPKELKPPKPIPKKYLQKIITVFEFKENPAGRFIIPKDSVLEALPNGDLLISSLLVHRSTISGPKSGNKQRKKKAQEDEAPSGKITYTPMTFVLIGLPKRVILTLERSVNHYSKAIRHMEKVFIEGERSQDYQVWFHIDENDEELQANLERPPTPPPNLVFPAKRQYKPRKKDGDGEEEESAYKKRKRRKMEEEARRKAEEEARKEAEGGGKTEGGEGSKTEEGEKSNENGGEKIDLGDNRGEGGAGDGGETKKSDNETTDTINENSGNEGEMENRE